ncbi:16S rRNA (cytosine(1402)-N(4))-methyltransferase RsmH [Oligoflexia bacterium]|nr:16S rRNA (cytosine(1402)-N(4))-methyltransferase RsmH [Oligoflexia bacterium]
MKSTCHISVMEREVVDALMAKQGGNFLDCTLGGAGHTLALLRANPENQVVTLDRDQRAVDRAAVRLADFSDRVQIMHGAFSQIETLVGEQSFHGVLADLGTSADQLQENRGFSFKDSSALDMRMNEDQVFSAADVVNNSGEQELFIILKQGGLGKEARAVQRAIVAARPITDTDQLAKVINRVTHGRSHAKKTNPATVAFQAIRMAVNSELEEIESLMDVAPKLVKAGGRLAVITFHSLEDKAVTKKMRSWRGSSRPALLPMSATEHDKPALGKMVGAKAVVPSEDEVQRNPGARSSRLRVFEFQGEG